MIYNFFKISLFGIVITLAYSCHDKCELPTVIPNGCPEMYDANSEPYTNIHIGDLIFNCSHGPNIVFRDKYFYYDPCVNPSNPYQIAFFRADTLTYGFAKDLCTYDFCTNQVKVIANNIAYGLDWSVKDWIVYTGTDLQLWKIKSNGDSLVRLTNTGTYNNYAKWNDSGDKLLYYDRAGGIGEMTICDENIENATLINVGMQDWDWITDSLIAFSSHYLTIKTLNLKNNVIDSIISFNDDDFIYTVNVPKNKNDLYVSCKSGVYRIDLRDKSKHLIFEAYGTYFGLFPTVTDDKIIMKRVVQDTAYNVICGVWQKYHLTISNLDGSNERRIMIPE